MEWGFVHDHMIKPIQGLVLCFTEWFNHHAPLFLWTFNDSTHISLFVSFFISILFGYQLFFIFFVYHFFLHFLDYLPSKVLCSTDMICNFIHSRNGLNVLLCVLKLIIYIYRNMICDKVIYIFYAYRIEKIVPNLSIPISFAS